MLECLHGTSTSRLVVPGLLPEFFELGVSKEIGRTKTVGFLFFTNVFREKYHPYNPYTKNYATFFVASPRFPMMYLERDSKSIPFNNFSDL